MNGLKVYVLFSLCFIQQKDLSHAYSRGPPDVNDVCTRFTPGHGYWPQEGMSPFSMTLSTLEFTPGVPLNVTLVGSRPFKGFLVQAFSLNGNKPTGSFAKREYARLICENMSGSNNYTNAITHREGELKNHFVLTWTPPISQKSSVYFKATVVENYQLFWVGMRSSIINMKITTTTSKTTTNQPTETPEELPKSARINTDDCGRYKYCFRQPTNCKIDKCNVFLSYEKVDSTLWRFEMSAISKGWVAFGLSQDKQMGADSVTECIRNSISGVVSVAQSYNFGHSNQGLSSTHGISNTVTDYVDGRIQCGFTREDVVPGKYVANLRQSWNVLFAYGPSNKGAKFAHSPFNRYFLGSIDFPNYLPLLTRPTQEPTTTLSTTKTMTTMSTLSAISSVSITNATIESQQPNFTFINTTPGSIPTEGANVNSTVLQSTLDSALSGKGTLESISTTYPTGLPNETMLTTVSLDSSKTSTVGRLLPITTPSVQSTPRITENLTPTTSSLSGLPEVTSTSFVPQTTENSKMPVLKFTISTSPAEEITTTTSKQTTAALPVKPIYPSYVVKTQAQITAEQERIGKAMSFVVLIGALIFWTVLCFMGAVSRKFLFSEKTTIVFDDRTLERIVRNELRESYHKKKILPLVHPVGLPYKMEDEYDHNNSWRSSRSAINYPTILQPNLYSPSSVISEPVFHHHPYRQAALLDELEGTPFYMSNSLPNPYRTPHYAQPPVMRRVSPVGPGRQPMFLVPEYRRYLEEDDRWTRF